LHRLLTSIPGASQNGVMLSAEKRLSDNFCCVKCRGKIARVQAVVLPMARIVAIFSGQVSPKFYVVSCTLCGYSELYDAKVYALQVDTSPAEEQFAADTGGYRS
jgi:predicted nucleic-acid-binding Zn-ribbon protein